MFVTVMNIKIQNIVFFSLLEQQNMAFVAVICFKMQNVIGILKCMGGTISMFMWVEYDTRFILGTRCYGESTIYTVSISKGCLLIAYTYPFIAAFANEVKTSKLKKS